MPCDHIVSINAHILVIELFRIYELGFISLLFRLALAMVINKVYYSNKLCRELDKKF